MDRLLSLLPRYGFRASVFYRGEYCGQTAFAATNGVGHLHLVRRGPVVMEHASRTPLVIEQPTLVFYPRPFDHRLVVPAQHAASLLCATVRFSHAERNPIALALPDVMCVPLDTQTGLSPTLDLLFSEAAADGIGKGLVMDHLCDVLVVHLVRYAHMAGLIRTGAIAGLADVQLAPVLSALHAHAARDWTVADMAALAHMSRTAFITRFRAVVGVPPAQYLAGWRMELAKNYLQEGKPVKEVARAVGYQHQPAFSRAFTVTYGVSPTEWLAQVGSQRPDRSNAQEYRQTMA